VMGQGFVDWPQTMAWLTQHAFAGPLTFHCEFPAGSTEALLAQLRQDVAYLRGMGA